MKLFAFVLAVMITFTSFGSNDADSVKVYFRVGQSRFDPSIGDNREQMDKCMAALRAYAESDIDSIIVRAYTSPDGTSKTNEILARQRCDSISDYIIANTGINPDLIRKIPEGIAWDGLKELVLETPDVPDRRAVLDILDNTPVWVFDSKGKIIGSRKSSLMSLDRGIPYNWMLNHLFPQLRNAVAIVVVTKEHAPEPSETSRDSVILEPSEPSEGTEILEPYENEEPSEPGDIFQDQELSRDSLPTLTTEDHFALSTNLLYYAALMPNLEAQWRINRRWTIAVDGDVAWWSKDLRKYRLAVITPEVRYRVLPRRDEWHGMYVGIFTGGGWYDLENGGNGYKGEGLITGVSVGYLWPIAKRLSLEAGLGVGYMYTRYKEYMPIGGHFLYQRTKDLNYFGPLKLKLSLVWRFGHRRLNPTNTNSVI